MRQQQSTILYAFIILILLAGTGLFIFKDQVANQLLNYNINGPTNLITKATSSDLKLDILRDSRIKALKNYVSVFDYENLDKSQEIILENAGKKDDVVISNPDETATSTEVKAQDIIRVRVGNSNPFLVKKAVK